MKLTINCRSYEVEVRPDAVVVGGVSYKTTVLHDNGDSTVRVAGRPYKVKLKDDKTVVVDGRTFTLEMVGRATVGRPAAKPGNGAGNGKDNGNCAENGAVRAMMPGTVLALRVQQGEQVCAGSVLLILEAMKMQNEIKAARAGVVKRIAVAPGQTVNNGDVLVVVE